MPEGPRAERAPRNTNLDVLRAVAALGVLAGHAYTFGGDAVPLRAENLTDLLVMQSIIGVWLFFGISGYLIARPFVRALVEGTPLPAIGGYALKRTLRIFPAYWAALGVVIVVVGAGATHAWQYSVHLALLQNLVPGREQAILTVAWTLSVELLFYAAVPLLAWLVRRAHPGPLPADRLAALVVVSWVGSVVYALGAATAGTGTSGVWLRAVFPARWCMFCPGILVAVAACGVAGSRWQRVLVDWPRGRAAGWWAAGILVAGAVLASVGPGGFTTAFFALREVGFQLEAIGFGLVVALALRARPWAERGGRPLVTLGLISYGIYLYHAVVATVLLDRGGVLLLGQGGLWAWVVHTAELLALTVPVAWLSWHLLEKPLIDLSHRLARRGGTAAPTTPAEAV